MRMRQICFRLPEKVVETLEEIRELTSIPISDLLKILLAGYRIMRIEDGREILNSETLFA